MDESSARAELPPLDGRAIRNCPVAVQLDADLVVARPRAPLTEASQKWRDQARTYRERKMVELASSASGTVCIVDANTFAERAAQTMKALSSDVSVIVNAAVNDDVVGGRRGMVDAIVCGPSGPYPLLVKHHRVGTFASRGTAVQSTLFAPTFDDAEAVSGVKVDKGALGDGLELAHLWRLFEAAGIVTAEAKPRGAILASDGAVWWFDLGEGRWGANRQSLLERYDVEFSLRRRIQAQQHLRNSDSTLEPVVVALHKKECARCRYSAHCAAEMAATDSVSLVAGMQWRHALAHRKAGVTSAKQLARLDPTSALVAKQCALAGAAVDLEALVVRAATVEPSRPIGTLLGAQTGARRVLQRAGFERASDLARLDRRTLGYPAVLVGALAAEIDRARASWSQKAYLARGVTGVECTRGVIEVDIDMERGDEGVYLWGALLTTTFPIDDVTNGYEALCSFEPLTPEVERSLLVLLLDHLEVLSAIAADNGGLCVAYCYSHAEADEMHRIAAGDEELSRRVRTLLKGGSWVDLRQTVDAHVVVGHGVGLKKMAAHAGFAWRDVDPSGSESIVWYERAVGSPDDLIRRANRERLLTYNEDDCRATLALRTWLTSASLENIASWIEPTVA